MGDGSVLRDYVEIKDICHSLKITQTGFISTCLEDLVKSGFISRDYTWQISSGDVSRLSHFRLSDNYIRFYLKYIDRARLKIENNEFAFKSLASLPSWDIIMGLQFENLVLSNRMYIKNYLGIKPEEVIADNPFFQRKTNQYPGCQIDYLIQTKYNTLFACEIKFSREKIGANIIPKMQKKLEEGKLSLEDVIEQVKSMNSLGGFDKIKSMIPGLSSAKIPENALENQEAKIYKWEHIIKSMTSEEKTNPEILEKQIL